MLKRSLFTFALLTLAVACQSKSDDASSDTPPTTHDATQEFRADGSASDPTDDTAANDDENNEAPRADTSSEPTTDTGKSVVSEDILRRDIVSEDVEVQHVLISWDEQANVYAQRGGQDPRGAERSKKDADKLALSILQKSKDGEDFVDLMRTYSEDPGSAKNGQSYPVRPDASLVQPFKDLSLRLEPQETGVVKSDFGYHVIYRVN